MSTAHAPAWGPIERRVALGSFGVATALIIFFLLRDASAFVNSANDELLGHVGASGGFTLAATGTLMVRREKRPGLLIVLLMGAAITIAAELAQGLAPSRGVQLRDIALGFAGVLLAGVVIELIFERSSLLRALRTHTAGAVVISLALATLLIFDLRPQTISDAAPDGQSCPFTTITGSRQRLTIGDELVVADDCVTTSAGGFGVFGPEGKTTVGDDAVLVSSPLSELSESIIDSQTLIVRAEFVTDDFDLEEVAPPGVIALLGSAEAGEVLQIRTRNQRTEIFGPATANPLRGATFAQLFEPETRYVMEVELSGAALIVRLDGELISSATIDPAWVDALEESDATDDLTLYIGNHPARTLPFHGTIEWIEIES